MTTQELANRYYDLFEKRQVAEIYQQFYSADIVCTEPEHAFGNGRTYHHQGYRSGFSKIESQAGTYSRST